MNKKYLKIVDCNNNIKEYEILYTFFNPNTNKNYVIYTDNIEEDGKLNIYASIYYPDDDTKLDEITTDDEWKYVELILENYN